MPPSLSTMGWDYAVFAVFVVASTAFPIWNERRGRQGAASKKNYVFATGRVSVFAIMMSLARGTLGVRTIIGYPSEQFYRGSAMFETIYGIAAAYPLVLWLFVPVFLQLDITSVYQYLDMRFNSRLVRGLASATFIARSLLTMSITIYTPCVALYTVMAVPFWASLLTLSGISICFTLFGGLKAAITADVIQGVTIIAVSVLVVVKGVMHSGGVANVFNINNDNDRFQFFHVGDMATRVDTVSATLGQAFIQISVLGCQQNLVQRYMSLRTKREVSKALYMNIPFVTFLFALPWICGTVVYAAYAYCDPRQLGLTAKADEILPFFVLDKLLVIPGCVGIFLATLFNGALCIYVSNLNSLATVLWEDFLSHLPRCRDFDDAAQLRAIKALGVMFAMFAFGGAFVVGLMTGVVEAVQLVSASTTGPLVGVFLLAMFVPVANWKGATAGMLVTLLLALVWSVGFLISAPATPFMGTSIEGCTNETFSPWIPYAAPVSAGSELVEVEFSSPVTMPPHVRLEREAGDEASSSSSVFSMTYMYYSVMGTVCTVLVGTLISWWTASETDIFEEKLLNPYFLNAMRWYRGDAELRKPSAVTETTPTATPQVPNSTVTVQQTV